MADQQTNFLPNFCGIRSVYAVVLVGELLAFVLTLVQPGGGSWEFLGLVSLFVQWIGLASAGLLCLLRPRLAALGNVGSALASYALILLVTLLVAGYAATRILAPEADGGVRWDFLGRSLLVAAIVAAVVLRYLYVQNEWRLRLQAAAEARIDALQARIRPHFLFNSLNTIASTIPVDPRTAESLVEDLADLFRASLAQRERLVPLTDELSLVQGYLNMERLRMGPRLGVEWAVEALPTDALIPPLTLQPLLENAVYYGIETREHGGSVRVRGRLEGEDLLVEVRNPAPRRRQRRRDGFGMAQANVRERLNLAFGPRARLSTREESDFYEVTVRVPYRRGGADENPHR